MGYLLNNYYRKTFKLSLSSQSAVISHIEVYVENTAMLNEVDMLSFGSRKTDSTLLMTGLVPF